MFLLKLCLYSVETLGKLAGFHQTAEPAMWVPTGNSYRGRPPRSVLLPPWLHRPKGHGRGRPPNNHHSLETDPASIFFFIGCPDISCFLHVPHAYPHPELQFFFFKG